MTLRKLMPAFLLLVALVASAAVTPSLRRAAETERVRATAAQDSDALRARNEGAFATILGEVRATASDLMFMKTNRYLHAGVAYDQTKLNLTSGDKQTRFAGCGPGKPTLIRSAEDDFRGFLGNLERQVKPYRPAEAEHHHTTMAELIPWFRVMTLANPHYVRGYRVGAAALLDEDKWQDAYDFLQEGLSNNPDHPKRFLLFQSLCSFHVRGQYFQDKYPFGDAWAERALAAAREACRLGLQQRPEHGQTGKIARDLQWNDDLEEDFAYAANMIPLLLSHLGRNEAALRQARELTQYMPRYEPLQRLIHRLETGAGTAPSDAETPTHKHEHEHDHEKHQHEKPETQP